jgi:D-erythro-7,8-dihydroneopterin triphosphate epimerase
LLMVVKIWVKIHNIWCMTKIKVKNLLLRTYIGFNPDELVNRQDVIINFEIETEVSHRTIADDDPDDILDYKSITKKVILLVQEGRFKLLEVLTQKILDLILQYDKVKWAKVEVDKPHALRFAESVSIEMEGRRKQVPEDEQ